MTTISGSTSALSSLMTLYSSENAKSGQSGTLTSDQVGGLVGMIDGDGTSATSNLDTLLGQSSTTSPTDLSTILDKIAAEKDADATASDTASNATTTQQKAASLMQSVYQSQQSSLFTLLG